MLNKVLRWIWVISSVIHWCLFWILIICVINGVNNPFIIILLCLYGIEIFLGLKKAISNENKYRNMYRKYLEMFENLKYIHKARYRLYFSGDTEQITKITNDFNECAKEQLELGKMCLENPNFSQQEKEEIQKIIDQTKQLIENIQPPV